MRRTAAGQLGRTVDRALDGLARNPVPVLLLAGAAAWLIYRLGEGRRRAAPAPDGESRAFLGTIPVLNAGPVHVYDPDCSPLRPGRDMLESRREMSARA